MPKCDLNTFYILTSRSRDVRLKANVPQDVKRPRPTLTCDINVGFHEVLYSDVSQLRRAIESDIEAIFLRGICRK